MTALTIENKPIISSFPEIDYEELWTDLNMFFIGKIEIYSMLLDFILPSKLIFLYFNETMVFHCEVMWCACKSNFDSGLNPTNAAIVHPFV